MISGGNDSGKPLEGTVPTSTVYVARPPKKYIEEQKNDTCM